MRYCRLIPTPSRDGGTGRRSGLKIRRGQPRGGSTPPPGTNCLLCESFSSIDISAALSGSVNGCNWVSYWVVPDVLEQTRQYLLDAQKLLSGKPTPLEFYD